MAKQSGGMPKIDEDFMKELISQGVPSKQDNNKTMMYRKKYKQKRCK